jgi:uridine phosphorylase
MTDFTIRENLAIIDGDVVMLRLGTCGTPQENIPVGSIVVNDSSVLVTRNPDAFRKGSKEEAYRISQPAMADKELITKVL